MSPIPEEPQSRIFTLRVEAPLDKRRGALFKAHIVADSHDQAVHRFIRNADNGRKLLAALLKDSPEARKQKEVSDIAKRVAAGNRIPNDFKHSVHRHYFHSMCLAFLTLLKESSAVIDLDILITLE